MKRELRTVAQARKQRDAATGTFHETIRRAYRTCTVREIGEAASLSPSRVWQIVKRGKK